MKFSLILILFRFFFLRGAVAVALFRAIITIAYFYGHDAFQFEIQTASLHLKLPVSIRLCIKHWTVYKFEVVKQYVILRNKALSYPVETRAKTLIL